MGDFNIPAFILGALVGYAIFTVGWTVFFRLRFGYWWWQ